MTKTVLLTVDGAVNVVLGALLTLFKRSLAEAEAQSAREEGAGK